MCICKYVGTKWLCVPMWHVFDSLSPKLYAQEESKWISEGTFYYKQITPKESWLSKWTNECMNEWIHES